MTSCVLSRLLRFTSSGLLFYQCRKSRILLHASFSEHHAIKTAHLSYSNFTGSQVLERIKYRNAYACYDLTTGSVPSYVFGLLHFYSPSRSLRSSSDTRMIKLNASSAKPMAFGICKTSVSTSRTISHKASVLLCLPSKANPKHFSSPDI